MSEEGKHMAPEQERRPVFTTYDADPHLREQEAEAADANASTEDDGSDADEEDNE